MGLRPGQPVHLIGAGFDNAILWPYENALIGMGVPFGVAEPVAIDAPRTDMFVRRFRMQAVIGLTGELVDALVSLGRDLRALLGQSTLVALPDAASTLRSAGLAPWTLLPLGPLWAFEPPEGGGAEYDRSEWRVESIDGELARQQRGAAGHPARAPGHRRPRPRRTRPAGPRGARVMNRALHSMTLGEILEEHRRARPQQLAVVGEGQRLTYPMLADRVLRLANALEQAGVRRGERVLWLAQNHPGVLEGIIACGQLGAMFCPVNWRQSRRGAGLRHRRPGTARSSCGRTPRSAMPCGPRATAAAIAQRAGCRWTDRTDGTTSSPPRRARLERSHDGHG